MMKNRHKTKIAIVIDTIASPTAGTEKQLLLLLNNLNRDKFEPTLCCLQSSEWLQAKFDLCPLHIIGIKSFKYPITFLKIWAFSRFLGKNNFDVVQTHFRDSNIVGILAARLAGIDTVISTRRGLPYWENEFGLVLLEKLNRWATFFIANSYNTQKWVIELEGVPAEKIQVIYNGIDLEPFTNIFLETRAKYRKLFNIPIDTPVVGIVANLRPVKGINIFLRAAQLVKEEVPEARFVIVGDGTEKKNLMGLSEELGLNGSVRFLGKRDDVVQILSAFDVGVLSSNFESFSNSIIEYLAAGLPVVCTDVGGCREAVENDVNGFVVPVGDFTAMANHTIEIIKRGLIISMSISSRHRARKLFALSRLVDAYMKTYCRLVVTEHESVYKKAATDS